MASGTMKNTGDVPMSPFLNSLSFLPFPRAVGNKFALGSELSLHRASDLFGLQGRSAYAGR